MNNTEKKDSTLKTIAPYILIIIATFLFLVWYTRPTTGEAIDNHIGVDATNHTIVVESAKHSADNITITTIDDKTVTFSRKFTKNYDVIDGAQKDGVIQYSERKKGDDVKTRTVNNYTN